MKNNFPKEILNASNAILKAVKNRVAITLSLLVICQSALSQEADQSTCYGDYRITQERIEGDIVQLEHCERIVGNVVISEALYLGTYSLINIKEIDGNLTIKYTNETPPLNNLRNIVTITGDLELYASDVLDLSMFSSLERVLGKLKLHSYIELRLRSVEGADNLEKIGELQIDNAVELLSLNGLTALKELDSLTLIGNRKLKDLSGLEAITSLSGDLTLIDNLNFESFSGLHNLQVIEGTMLVKDNYSLTAFNGLSALERVDRKLKIISNDALVSLNGLDELNHIGKLVIYSNSELENLTSLNRIETLDHLNIMKNRKLNSLKGLEGLVTVAGEINIDDNYGLITLEGLNNLEHASRLSLTRNRQLTSLSAIENLASLSMLRINFNSALESIDGFGSLTELQDCYIDDQRNLVSVEGLIGLQTISRTLSLRYNPKLEEANITTALSNEGLLLVQGTSMTP